MGKMKRSRALISIVTGILLLGSQLAFAMEPSVSILGDIVGKGTTEMQTAFNKWISVSDKAYPLMDGSHLRSGDGTMSSIFRDGARMEVGKNSEITVTGARGNYAVGLSKGKIAFSLPQGISFSVTTPTSAVQTRVQPNMIQMVSTTSQDYVRGSVGYDGKGTTITAVSGTLLVKDAKGVAAYTVTAGNSIYIAGSESGYRATPTQTPPPQAAPQTRTAPNPPPPAGSNGEQTAIIAGGALIVMGGTFWLAESLTRGPSGTASVSVP